MEVFSVFFHDVQVLGTGVSTARPANSGWVAAQFNSVDQAQQMVIQHVQPFAALCSGARTSRLKSIPVKNNDQRLVGFTYTLALQHLLKAALVSNKIKMQGLMNPYQALHFVVFQ